MGCMGCEISLKMEHGVHGGTPKPAMAVVTVSLVTSIFRNGTFHSEIVEIRVLDTKAVVRRPSTYPGICPDWAKTIVQAIIAKLPFRALQALPLSAAVVTEGTQLIRTSRPIASRSRLEALRSWPSAPPVVPRFDPNALPVKLLLPRVSIWILYHHVVEHDLLHRVGHVPLKYSRAPFRRNHGDVLQLYVLKSDGTWRRAGGPFHKGPSDAAGTIVDGLLRSDP